jgi:prepilin-type N-terminal cleavage/methylation domain-containing protein
MKAPLTLKTPNDADGFSVLEVVVVLAIVCMIGGFAIVSLVKGNRTANRTSTATEIGSLLQKARADSMRRNAKDFNQMAQVKIFNRRFYSIAIDGDGDGNLDVPLVKSLAEQSGMEIEGPFPKSYIFNAQGETVDSQNNRVSPQLIMIGNGSGASVIKFNAEGNVVVVPNGKVAPAR